MAYQRLRQPERSTSLAVPGLSVHTGLRAGGTTASNELIEATRNFLQSLLNALPPAANTTVVTTPAATNNDAAAK